jgi:beta-N-acetylhexosaminidase
LSRQRIQASVAKVLAAKERVGLDRKRVVDLEAIGDVINSPEANEKAQEVADRAVTLVRNGNAMIPLASPESTCFVTLTEGRFSTEGQAFAHELKERVKNVAIVTLDPSMTRQAIDDSLSKLSSCQSYVVNAFASVAANRGSVGLAGELPHAVEAVAAAGKPIALVAIGNPYLLRSFPNLTAYLATFSTVPTSEESAVKALLGEIPIRGHLPVSIPGLANLGEGVTTQAVRAVRISQ